MVKVRVVFEKKGRAKYISHLDLNRCMQRTFKRSGLPVWYTEGFNPHIYIMFALPLSLGYESSVEIMDFNLNEEVPFDEITDRLNSVMPEGLRAVKAFSPVNKHTAIKSASFRISFKTDDPENLSRKFDEFMSQEQINTVKKTKRGGKKLIDLKPDISILNTGISTGRFEVNAVFPAGTEKNLNPSLLTDLFEEFCGNDIQDISVKRTGIFMGNMNQEFV
ncbi:MAG: TIGR03936 family radical SAM-associated protein [Porcipelethomonas sp.]